MCGCGGDFLGDVFGDISDAAGDIYGNTVGAVFDTVRDVVDFVISDLVFGTVGTVFEIAGLEDVGNTFRQIGDTLTAGTNAFLNFGSAVLKDPKQIYTGQDGFSLNKLVGFVSAVVASVATWNPGPLISWAVVNSGAVNAVIAEMAKKGWISESQAMILAITGNIAVMYFGMTAGSGAVPGQGFQNFLGYSYEGLISLGVSAETAGMIISSMAEYGMLVNSFYTTAQYGYQAYDVYQTYQEIVKLEAESRAAEAQFEAWLARLKQTSKKDDAFINSFISGAYYKRLAGQPLFNVNLPARERYVPIDVQKPSWWIEGTDAYKADPFVANIMWDDKNSNLPGGSSFMSIQMDNTMIKSQH